MRDATNERSLKHFFLRSFSVWRLHKSDLLNIIWTHCWVFFDIFSPFHFCTDKFPRNSFTLRLRASFGCFPRREKDPIKISSCSSPIPGRFSTVVVCCCSSNSLGIKISTKQADRELRRQSSSPLIARQITNVNISFIYLSLSLTRCRHLNQTRLVRRELYTRLHQSTASKHVDMLSDKFLPNYSNQILCFAVVCEFPSTRVSRHARIRSLRV